MYILKKNTSARVRVRSNSDSERSKYKKGNKYIKN